MGKKTWFKDMLDEFKDDFDFRLETLILDLTDDICRKMEQKNITRADLARKLDISPAAVTKILNGNSNFTLKTILKIAMALDTDPIVGLAKDSPAPIAPKGLPSTRADDSTACRPATIDRPLTA